MQSPERSRSLIATAIGVLAVVALAPCAAAPGSEVLLQGRAVTESNVLDALTPVPEDDADVQRARTRSLRIAPAGTPSTPPTSPRPSAALLITFETDSAALTQRSREQLDVVAAALKNQRLRDFRFEVAGHADSRGVAAANQVLSQRRAQSVRQYLVVQHDIPEPRLQAVGKGDTEPMNARNIAAPENRRVTITTLAP